MEREQDNSAIDRAMQAMQDARDRIDGLRVDEVSCMYRPSEPTISLDQGPINPDLGIVEDGSDPSTHPLRSDLIRSEDASGIGEVQNPTG